MVWQKMRPQEALPNLHSPNGKSNVVGSENWLQSNLSSTMSETLSNFKILAWSIFDFCYTSWLVCLSNKKNYEEDKKQEKLPHDSNFQLW